MRTIRSENAFRLWQWTVRRQPFDLRDNLFTEPFDRFQGQARLHPRPVHHEPHKLGAEFFVVRHHLFDDFGRASEYQTIAFQLIELEIVALTRLPPLLVAPVAPLVAFLDALLGFAGRIGDTKIAKNKQPAIRFPLPFERRFIRR